MIRVRGYDLAQMRSWCVLIFDFSLVYLFIMDLTSAMNITPTVNIIFNHKDTTIAIFSRLDSYTRAVICTVSLWFSELAVHTSMLLAPPHLLLLYRHTVERTNREYLLSNMPQKQLCQDIAADAHLLLRLNWQSCLMFYKIGQFGDINIIQNIMLKSHNYHRTLIDYIKNGLARADRISILEQFSCYITPELAYHAAKGGSMNIIETTMILHWQHRNQVVRGACRTNNTKILELFSKQRPMTYQRSAAAAAAKGGHLELLKQIMISCPQEDIYTTAVIANGPAMKKQHMHICEYLRPFIGGV